MSKYILHVFASPEELKALEKKPEVEDEEEDEELAKKKKKDEDNVNRKLSSPYDLKCALAAKFGNVTIEVKPHDVSITKDPEFQKKTPTHTLPLLETDKGTVWQSGAIARFFASVGTNKDLRGTGLHAAQVDQIMDFVESNSRDVGELIHAIGQGKKLGKIEQKAADTQLEKLNTVLGHLLDVNTFLAGDRLTLADVHVFALYRWLFVSFWEPEDRKKIRSLTRWFTTMLNQKQVKDVVGEIKLKEKKIAKVESKFNMEEWKRIYMNSPTDESIKYFWANLDVKINSVWVCHYKHNDDLKGLELYVVGNRLGGMQQRQQDFAKTTFGVMLIVGTETAPEITCLWVYESKQVPKEIQDEIDYPMFNWTRADWGKDKDMVNEYLKAEGNVGGKKVLDARTFR
jgi:elongation factor 1-gamma